MDQSVALKRAGSDAEALSIIRSNRGKALMDEINVFLYGAMLSRRKIHPLRGRAAEQCRHAAMGVHRRDVRHRSCRGGDDLHGPSQPAGDHAGA